MKKVVHSNEVNMLSGEDAALMDGFERIPSAYDLSSSISHTWLI